ncbi:hypothetical protein N9H22_03320 [Opitutales bacterium]|nr:hypothetical protein [Opitutales bacterium]
MNQDLPDPNNRPIVGLKSKGFALVITLALVSFVFLLVISLISQVRMDLAYSDVRQDHILAKAHARMGMMIAIGEIQKHLGPDMRVSTTADIYDDRVESEKDYLISGYPLNNALSESAELYGSGTNRVELGQRQWTGVWKHRGGWSEPELPTLPLPENRDIGDSITKSWSIDTRYDPHPAIEQAWLVSGNEGWNRKLAMMDEELVDEFIEVPDGIIIDDLGKRILNDPLGGIYGQDDNPWVDHRKVVEDLNSSRLYHHPLMAIEDPLGLDNPNGSDQSVWLLKSPLLREEFDANDPLDQQTWTNFLQAEPVKVLKTALHLSDDQRDEEEEIDWGLRRGSYAYWVGDEGVKTKINIMEPFRIEEGKIVDLLNEQNKLKVATEPNIEVGSFGFDFGSGSQKDDEQRKDLITPLSVKELFEDGSSSAANVANHHYHSITTDSFGVLADVRTGGLKRDLSLVFSLNQETSKAWEKDFADNFIFRDRVTALKNIPLNTSPSRNKWYSANNATVKDEDALLAGPPWSVLADYHNLDTTDGMLFMQAPDQFPRTVGDNALIFGRRAPKSQRNAFPNASSAYPFYNCFSSSVRKLRPEPKNHSIFPILTKCKFSMVPIGIDQGQPTKAEYGLALSPAVTLWNPYNHEMQLDNLYLEIPFSAHNGNAGSTKSVFTSFDLREYDLYRKWWAYVIDVNNTDELKASHLSKSGEMFSSGKIKNKWEPWGLYEFQKGSIDKSTGGVIDFRADLVIKEPGLFNAFKDQTYALKSSYLGIDSAINLSNWNTRTTPDSLYGIKMEGKKLYHEAPRDLVGDYTFDFKTLENGQIRVNKLILRILSNSEDSSITSLLPGEVATFAVFKDENDLEDVTINDGTAQINVYKWEDGAVERASLLKSGYDLDSKNPESVQLFLENATIGIEGYVPWNKKLPAEKFERDGNLSKKGWASSEPYKKPVCLTLWQGHPDRADSTPLTKWTSSFVPSGGAVEVSREYDSYTTVSYLKSNYNRLLITSERDLMIGVGWSVEMTAPGARANERIHLIEFNNRALVHSNQHGKGNLFAVTQKYSSSHYFDNDGATLAGGNDSFRADIQIKINDYYKGQFQYTVNDKNFSFNNWNNEYSPNSPKAFPDFFMLPSTADQPIPGNFNQLDDVSARASLLGFENSNKIIQKEPIFDLSLNPDFEDLEVPASKGQERVGFSMQELSAGSPYTGKFTDSHRAVLFEIPDGKVLSLLQYKHANLNNYLHGPTYSLGNSYATTQVARHRSWGRVQTIESKPTADQGLLNLVQNSKNRGLVDEYYSKILGPGVYESFTLKNDWDWSVDFSLGYGAWRATEGQNNHQNTTLDHSFYLNRSLLDGFFLSGSSSKKQKDYIKEKNAVIGQRFRPYLWDATSGAVSNVSQDLNVSGNHRFIGYFRNNQWEDVQTSYGEKSKEKGFSTADDSKYRYQTVASDVIVDGAFNINSTSVDAWKAQLSSLRGNSVYKLAPPPLMKYQLNNNDETPVVRFLREPLANDGPNSSWQNSWNDFRKLSDAEISDLAIAIVKQVKLRGPFLSMADFVNRRLALGPTNPNKAKGTRVNFIEYDIKEWNQFSEDRYTAQGLRGAVQSAIADAGLNDDNLGTSWQSDGWIPKIPQYRYSLETRKFFDSSFGLHASSLDMFSDENGDFLDPNGNLRDRFGRLLDPNAVTGPRTYGKGAVKTFKDKAGPSLSDGVLSMKVHKIDYPSTNFGEAPENLLAVEHLATGANKPGWVMQSDLLSPLIPVTSARSDTFIIRVMGETNNDSPARAWAELVVQRTPDYVKADLDAPHHRPHEPIKDINLNGYWDNGLNEHWIDLNRNGDTQPQPDLPGVGELGRQKDYRDGMLSDLKLQMDPQEEDIESTSQISYQGINQRFGRKFKIIRFRWLREKDV